MNDAHDTLAAIQRMGAQEYAGTNLAGSHSGITRRVRRDRTVRAGIATLAGAGVLGAGTLGILQLRGADAVAPMGSPSPTATGTTPTPTSAPSDSPEPEVSATDDGTSNEAPVSAQVVVDAGDRVDQIVADAAQEYDVSEDSVREAILAALPEQANGEPEGWLGVGDYGNVQDVETLAHKFTGNQEMVLTDLGVDPEDWHEVLTIASIVQAEAVSEDDMPNTASVIVNRLAAEMELQVESPLFYYADINGLDPSDDGWDIDTQFNTYRYDGLPPTPINSPSRAAIAAAANAGGDDWLYFAGSFDRGIMLFATTFREHQENLVELGKLEPEDVL